mgnify:CR=1 FL=1
MEILPDIQSLVDKELDAFYQEHPAFGMIERVKASAYHEDERRNISIQLSADELSALDMNLAMLMTEISVAVARKTSAHNEKYSRRGLFQAHQYLSHREKSTQGDAEIFAKLDAKEYLIQELVSMAVADTLKAKERSYFTLISVIQSRLGVIKNENINAMKNR